MNRQSEAERLRDVVVVGAGLAGSGVAAALARRGWDVLLVERDRLPRHKVCGEFLSPEAQGSLAQLGLLEAAAALAPVPLYGAAITTPGGATVAMPLPAAAWGLSRYALDAGLAAGAARHGAEVWQGATVLSAARQGERCRVKVRRAVRSAGGASAEREQCVTARALIMACGRHSTAALPPRDAVSGQAQQGWRHCVGLKCHYEKVTMEPRVELYLFSGGYVGINPIEDGRANVCVLITYAAFQAAGKSLACVLEEAVRRHPELARRLQGARLVTQSECAVAPVDTQRTPAPWDAALAAPCLGDTAAMIPPLAGDGMAMALRSAELCCAPADGYLRGDLARTEWQDAYTRGWRTEFEQRLWLGRSLQSALTTPLLGDVLATLGQRLPGVAQWLLAGTRGRAR